MRLKQTLSWEFLLPLGIICQIIFRGGILELFATLLVLMGVVDLFRAIFSNRRKNRDIKAKTKLRMKELGVNAMENYSKYYEIREDEERKYKALEVKNKG